MTRAVAPSTPASVVEDYIRRGAPGDAKRRRQTAAFHARFRDSSGWERAPLADQLAAEGACGRFVAWLIVTAMLRPSADYLLACRGHLAALGDLAHPQLAAEFAFTGDQLGFSTVIVRRQWSALLQIAAVSGSPPTRLSTKGIGQAMSQFSLAARRLAKPGPQPVRQRVRDASRAVPPGTARPDPGPRQRTRRTARHRLGKNRRACTR